MKISIIIAIYNAEQFLEQCLDSILNQTLEDYELICVDDGSTDGTVDILNQYKKRDSRIKILHHEHTGKGAAGARNMGLESAKGEYLLFLDADDYFSLFLLEHTYQKAEERQTDIVMYDARAFDHNTGNYLGNILRTEYVPEQEVFSGKDAREHLYRIASSAAWSMLFRRSFIKEYRLRFQEVYGPDDLFFVYASLSAAKRITVLKEELLFYRKNIADQQTLNIHKSPLAITQAYTALQEWLEERGLFETYAAVYYECALTNFQSYISRMDTYEAYSELYEHLRNKVFDEIGMTEECLEQYHIPKNLRKWFSDVCGNTSGKYAWNYMKENQRGYRFRYAFSSEQFQNGQRVVLYGAGSVGKDFYIQNSIKNYCTIVAWVDKRAEKYGFPISGKETMHSLEYDNILIAVEQKEIADSIRCELLKDGIDDRKIHWIDPVPAG